MTISLHMHEQVFTTEPKITLLPGVVRRQEATHGWFANGDNVFNQTGKVEAANLIANLDRACLENGKITVKQIVVDMEASPEKFPAWVKSPDILIFKYLRVSSIIRRWATIHNGTVNLCSWLWCGDKTDFMAAVWSKIMSATDSNGKPAFDSAMVGIQRYTPENITVALEWAYRFTRKPNKKIIASFEPWDAGQTPPPDWSPEYLWQSHQTAAEFFKSHNLQNRFSWFIPALADYPWERCVNMTSDYLAGKPSFNQKEWEEFTQTFGGVQ